MFQNEHLNPRQKQKLNGKGYQSSKAEPKETQHRKVIFEKGDKKDSGLVRASFHFSLSCIGEGNGNPLQCSCLENPRDRGAWWAAVYGVGQSRTRLKKLSSGSSRASFTTIHIILKSPTVGLLVVQWLRIWSLCAWSLDSSPSQQSRSHMPQLNSLHSAMSGFLCGLVVKNLSAMQ